MKASVIIPTKNPGSIFKEVLPAVINQKTPWEYEVLVVDSGSDDGTVEYAERYENVRVHKIKPSEFGHGRTRNLGIGLTTGEYVVLITHDALPANDTWLLNMVAAVEQSPSIAGAFGRHKAYASDGPYVARDLEAHFDGFKASPHVVRLDDRVRYSNETGYRQFLHFFSDNNACLRRSVWEKIPYPDVDFAEDQIWAKTVIEHGYSKAYADNALVYHSHQFGFWETCQRSFDEAMALNRLFEYKLCPTVQQLFGQALLTTLADIRYSVSRRKLINEILWVVRSPLRNMFRQIGYYLGQRHNSLSDSVVIFMSRDKRLLKN